VGPSSPEADGVVGHDLDDPRLGQRGDADGITHVVREDEEGGHIGNEPREVLRHPVAQWPPWRARAPRSARCAPRGVLLEVAVLLQERHVGGRQVEPTPDEPGQARPPARSGSCPTGCAWRRRGCQG